MRIASELGARGGYEAELRGDGVIQIVIHGVWSEADVDAFFAALEPLTLAARRRKPQVDILTIVEAVQSPLVAGRVRHHALAIKRPGDRRAFVVATFLSKLQIKRLASTDAFALFTDRATAEAWLKG